MTSTTTIIRPEFVSSIGSSRGIHPSGRDLELPSRFDPNHIVLDSTDVALTALSRGEVIIVVDDEDRENEGDLIVSAEHATPEMVNFMITYARGLVCTAITRERGAELALPYMVERNEDARCTAFTVSVDGSPEHGVTTGISAPDRAKTIELMVKGDAGDLRRPGHIFPLLAEPGGVLVRNGHTEAAVDMCRLAGLAPAGVIVEIIDDDGHMARLPQLARFASTFGLVMTSIAQLQDYRRDVEGKAA